MLEKYKDFIKNNDSNYVIRGEHDCSSFASYRTVFGFGWAYKCTTM